MLSFFYGSGGVYDGSGGGGSCISNRIKVNFGMKRRRARERERIFKKFYSQFFPLES